VGECYLVRPAQTGSMHIEQTGKIPIRMWISIDFHLHSGIGDVSLTPPSGNPEFFSLTACWGKTRGLVTVQCTSTDVVGLDK
jgi:hypothetical protein